MNHWVIFASKYNAVEKVHLMIIIPTKIIRIKIMPLLFIMGVSRALIHKKVIIF